MPSDKRNNNMQGILRSHYKLIEDYLNKLLAENVLDVPCPYQYESILAHKEKLNEIYDNYQETLSQMSALKKQFEEHKQSVRRLIILQKKKKKEVLKTQSQASVTKMKTKKSLLVSTT